MGKGLLVGCVGFREIGVSGFGIGRLRTSGNGGGEKQRELESS